MSRLMLASALAITLLAGCAAQPEYVSAFENMRAAEVRLDKAKSGVEDAQATLATAVATSKARQAEFAERRANFEALYLRTMKPE